MGVMGVAEGEGGGGRGGWVNVKQISLLHMNPSI